MKKLCWNECHWCFGLLLAFVIPNHERTLLYSLIQELSEYRSSLCFHFLFPQSDEFYPNKWIAHAFRHYSVSSNLQVIFFHFKCTCACAPSKKLLSLSNKSHYDATGTMGSMTRSARFSWLSDMNWHIFLLSRMKRRPEVSPSTLESDLHRLVQKADLYDDLHDVVIEVSWWFFLKSMKIYLTLLQFIIFDSR